MVLWHLQQVVMYSEGMHWLSQKNEPLFDNIFSTIDEPNSLKIFTEQSWGIINKSAKNLQNTNE